MAIARRALEAARRELCDVLIIDTAAGIGDGVVSFDSAHLDDVESEIVVEADRAGQVVQTIREAANTNKIGDGKIFVLPVEEVIGLESQLEKFKEEVRDKQLKI